MARPCLEGDLELRLFEPTDAEPLQSLLGEPEVRRWWPDGDYDGENGWIWLTESGFELSSDERSGPMLFFDTATSGTEPAG
jgi:hypothetical protein